MNEIEKEQRARVVQIAKSWERTPYRHAARIKGVGCDCLTLLAEVFHEAILIPKIEIPFYPHDWMLHRDAERYLEGVMQYAVEKQSDPLPGDIVVWKVGRCFSHGAIVLEWPEIIHAQIGCTVTRENAENATYLTHIGEKTADYGKRRPMRIFSYWGK